MSLSVPGGTVTGGNLRLNTNTLESTNTNGNILIDPNGTGTISLVGTTAVTGTLTASTGLTATTGNIAASSGNLSASGNLNASGVITFTDAGVLGANATYYLVPKLIGSSSVASQTTPITLVTITVPVSNTVYSVEGVVDVNTFTSGSGEFSATWTPPGKNTQNTAFAMSGTMAGSNAFASSINAVNQFCVFTQTFLVKGGTTFTINISGTFVMNYSARAIVRQISI
jgi:hypothetical protein